MLKSKSIQISDYDELTLGLKAVTKTLGKHPEANFYFPHEHRWWEYGSALTAFEEEFWCAAPDVKVLDVGGGHGILGPVLAENYNCTVLELELDPKIVEKRNALGIPNLLARQGSILDFDGKKEFNAVFCISVIEHIPEWKEALDRLIGCVAEGGLLVITLDYGKEGEQAWVNDSERDNKFTEKEVREIVSHLYMNRFDLWPVDYTFHGPQVFDYTFFRIIARHRPGSCM